MASFAAIANPSHSGLPDWPTFDTARCATIILDENFHTVDDLAAADRHAQEALSPRR